MEFMLSRRFVGSICIMVYVMLRFFSKMLKKLNIVVMIIVSCECIVWV